MKPPATLAEAGLAYEALLTIEAFCSGLFLLVVSKCLRQSWPRPWKNR
ncbi:MAG: hypothetical protein R2857_00660 [Vampirovibrionales bacterium]